MVEKFHKANVAVTLTGAEWTTILGLLLGKPLSDEGARVAREATKKLGAQVMRTSDILAGKAVK